MRAPEIRTKLALLGLAALVALGGAELAVRYGVGYPPRPATRIYFVGDRLGIFGRIHWSKPYARFWNVEAGNRVFRYNNLGLPGGDVRSTPESPHVFLLGSSWVEALQVESEQTASAVLQRRLEARGTPLQVLNLGASGADPYISWRRSRFFASHFQPGLVVLVLEEFHTRWMSRHPQPLEFTLGPRFGTEEVRTGSRRILAAIRERSAFANLVANGRTGRAAKEPDTTDAAPTGSTAPRPPEPMPDNLREVLRHFRADYGDRFLVFSLLLDGREKEELAAFCGAEGVQLVMAPEVMDPENRFNGTGHLNVLGNRELGEALYAAIVAARSQP